MKTKTKKQLRKHAATAKAGAKQIVKVKRHVGQVVRKRIVKRRTGQLLLRSFFILVAAVLTGSLAFTINHTKPTVEIEIRTNIAKAVKELNPKPSQRAANQAGMASWYALGLPAPDSLTCASTTFPRGTYLLVTNIRNRRQVICLVNDYGPQPWTNRVIDLSRGSFRVIESLGAGTTPVEIRVVPAPSRTLNLPFPETYSASIGYSACGHLFPAQWCDQYRQDTRTLH